MRVMLKVSMPVEKANRAIEDGSMAGKMQAILGDLKPEAAYFLAYGGKRTSLIFFDLADPSQIPAVAEPFFIGLDAEVDFYPVMNAEDLGKGLPAAMDAVRKYK
jgi:hypothetical protein